VNEENPPADLDPHQIGVSLFHL